MLDDGCAAPVHPQRVEGGRRDWAVKQASASHLTCRIPELMA